MAEPTFEEYLREREQIEKRMNMERLMEEFKEDMRKKKVMEQKQMASAPDPMDSLNDLAQMLFGKNLDELTDNERDALDNYNKDLMAKGGRVLKQTGGITETRTLPPEFIEAAQKTYLTDLSRQAGIPSITTAVQQQPGETAAQFAQRQAQAQQFGITRAGMAELAPQVAAQDAYQAAAYSQAVDPTTGLGSFQPFLTAAQTAATGATALTGTGAGTGAGSVQLSPEQPAAAQSSPLMTALGLGLAGADIYGRIFR